MSAHVSTPPSAPDRLVIRRPDDWHVHLRDGEMLAAVVNATARQFARAIVMPNLKPPVTTAAAGAAYRDRIRAAVDPALDFTPLMTCYLTDGIAGDELARGHGEGIFTAAKLYPANATTNSAHGVTDVTQIRDALETMQRIGMPLLIHGEVTDTHVDIFDREAVFIDRTLTGLVRDYPAFEDRLRTYHYRRSGRVRRSQRAQCRRHHHPAPSRHQPQRHVRRRHPPAPVLPAGAEARKAPAGAAQGGDERQPEILPRHRFGTACRCHQGNRLRLRRLLQRALRTRKLCQTFEEEGALDRLEGFASEFGPAFYGLPRQRGTVTLERAADNGARPHRRCRALPRRRNARLAVRRGLMAK